MCFCFVFCFVFILLLSFVFVVACRGVVLDLWLDFLWFRGRLGSHFRRYFWKHRQFSQTGEYLVFKRFSDGFGVFSKVRASRQASLWRRKRVRETSGILSSKRYGPGWIFPDFKSHFGEPWSQSGLQNLTFFVSLPWKGLF